MQQYIDTMEYEFDDSVWIREQDDHDHMLSSSIQELESINKTLSKLLKRKEDLTDNIVCALGAAKKGQKTYDFHTWKIEVRTPTPKTTVNIKERI